jgi:nitrogen regulatory protein P-II 1
MKRENVTYVTDASLLNCIVPLGKADTVLKAARDLGVGGGIVYHGKGTGLRERLGLLGIAVEAEKEIVVMVVANERRDMIIDELFQAAEMDALSAGFIFATPVDKMALYIPEESLNQVKDA